MPDPHPHPNEHPHAKSENFHVLSPFLPRALRPDFAALYWFCRTTDDLADEHDGSPAARANASDALADFSNRFHAALAHQPPNHPTNHPTPSSDPFARLARVIHARALPVHLFDDLIDAFQQDQRITRYDTLDQLIAYSTRSANPVGRLVLRLLHAHHPLDLARAEPLSDHACTALQLANFWQDIRRDLLDRDRIYLPLRHVGLTEADLRAWVAAPLPPRRDPRRQRAAEILAPLVASTHAMLRQADPLPTLLPPRHQPIIHLFLAGCDAVLRATIAQGYTTPWRRPRVTAPRKAALLLRVALRHAVQHTLVGPLRHLRPGGRYPSSS